MARAQAGFATAWWCGALLLAALPGCLSRTLYLDSEPSGAAVRLDGVLVGTTPYEEPIPAYGTRRLQLELPGHETLRTDLAVDTPWYEFWPIDFVPELLWPFGVTDERRFRFALRPAAPLPDDWATAEATARRAKAAAARLKGG